MKLKLKLIAACGAMALAGAASAQGYNWDGYYVGFNVGNQHAKSDMRTSTVYTTTGAWYFQSASVTSIDSNGAGSGSRNEAHVGVAFGHNSRMGGQVLGYELDLSFVDVRLNHGADVKYPCCNANYSITQQVHAHNLITARGRWGALVGEGLLYVTGGAAWARISSKSTLNDTYGLSGNTFKKSMKSGWALGVGYEFPMSNGWNLKAEYLHTKFGKVSSSSNNFAVGNTSYSANPLSNSGDLKLDIVRIGFNKKF